LDKLSTQTMLMLGCWEFVSVLTSLRREYAGMCLISTLMLAKWHAAADIKVHERVLGGQKVKRDMEVNLPRSAQIVPPAGENFLRWMEARLLNAKSGSVCERTKWMDPGSRGIGGSGAVFWLRDLKGFLEFESSICRRCEVCLRRSGAAFKCRVWRAAGG
jgi:hypothetical protein